MRCVDRRAGVVLTPPWLFVVTLVVTLCMFSKGLKWTYEKVVSYRNMYNSYYLYTVLYPLSYILLPEDGPAKRPKHVVTIYAIN